MTATDPLRSFRSRIVKALATTRFEPHCSHEQMKQSRSIPWPRIFAEGTIIVVSILLAFWIDAWWQSRQAKASEEVVLQTLLDDLLAKRQLLDERNRFVDAIRESAETLLRISSGNLNRPDEDSIDELISDIWWVSNEAQWTSAPLESLAASGDLSLISSPELVQSLEALRVAIERVKYHSRNDQEFHLRIMTPFMIEHADMAQITASMNHRPGQPEVAISATDYGFGRRQQHSELLASVAFQNLLIAKIERCLDLLEIGHPGVEHHLDSAVRMLELELATQSSVR